MAQQWQLLVRTSMICCLDAGPIIEQVQAQFDIVAAQGVWLKPASAEQFHAVYKGVVAPALFTSMVQELASGAAAIQC